MTNNTEKNPLLKNQSINTLASFLQMQNCPGELEKHFTDRLSAVAYWFCLDNKVVMSYAVYVTLIN